MTSTTAPGVTVEAVTVTFGALRALDDVSLIAQPGHIHGVIGPNGAGKSSLFNVISGVYQVDTGSVHLDGELLTGQPVHRGATAGVARSFQNVDLGGTETVLESLLVGRHHLMGAGVLATMLGLPGARREERRHVDRVREIADFCGLGGLLDRPLRELPYGQRKLSDIARAVCMEPRLLMLDEPAAGLDHLETQAISRLVLELRSALDMTVLLIEHDMGLVMGTCDRITVLDFGRRIADGTPAEIQRDSVVTAAYLGTGEPTEPTLEGAS